MFTLDRLPLCCYTETSSSAVQKRQSKVYGYPIAPSLPWVMWGPSKKFGPDRFSRLDVYWMQTDKQTDEQSIHKCLNFLSLIIQNFEMKYKILQGMWPRCGILPSMQCFEEKYQTVLSPVSKLEFQILRQVLGNPNDEKLN